MSSDFLSREIIPVNSFQFEFEDSIDDNLKKTKQKKLLERCRMKVCHFLKEKNI